MENDELMEFCKNWLDAWTGNHPHTLPTYYSEDALYVDPANKDGLHGHQEIAPYFSKLLKANPKWIWRPIEIFKTDKGFTLKWECKIPVGDEVITEFGLDIIELKEKKIIRNEVYFDRTTLLSAIRKARSD